MRLFTKHMHANVPVSRVGVCVGAGVGGDVRHVNLVGERVSRVGAGAGDLVVAV